MDIQYLRMVGWSLGHVVIHDQRVFNLEPALLLSRLELSSPPCVYRRPVFSDVG
jgi:hypothetical protein